MTRIMRTHFVAIALVLAAVNVIAQGLPTARPEDEGFSPERLAYIDQFYSAKIDHAKSFTSARSATPTLKSTPRCRRTRFSVSIR